MYIQGDLQTVFDVLYTLGVIDPVLEKDWKKSFDEFEIHEQEVNKAFGQLNLCKGDATRMVESLKAFDQKTLEYVAMEVAKEFADFYSRKVTH